MKFFWNVEGIDGILVHGFAVISLLHKSSLYSNHCSPDFMFVSNVKKPAKDGTAWSVEGAK